MFIQLSLLPRLECAWGLMLLFLAGEHCCATPREWLQTWGSVPCPARGFLRTVVAQSLCQPCTLLCLQLGRLERTQVPS